ncbi:uncharacterized protein LY89DRAFT_729158 [Mollisia scopiformis]|uniref:CorA-like transporter domain-containing protein n=1 Tax=Mollisia scopiformis TaxID=149040 RepID=A0A194XN04_MOLSC|nr:uncharacterized protein LY89DRAFT_729158 [Mollisia scopiformis]KUJ21645.1 hypothetical protein LY89DRAFT_729158 [Mollisia scopiformis]
MHGIEWVDSTVIEDIDITFKQTFVLDKKDSNLVLKRLRPISETNGDSEALKFLWTTDVSDFEAIQNFSHRADPCQIYCIRQKHSYARLYITKELFDQLLIAYSVFSRIWDFVLPFSFKTRESDLVNAPFRFRQLEHLKSPELGSFECAYGFRYVELNHRTLARRENPDYDPWSVRQSAVYQRYDSKYNRIMFILITPSETARKNLEEAVKNAIARPGRLNAFDLHRILLSTLHENWRLYVRSLENLMTQQSERVVLAEVKDENTKLSPLTDLKVNFVDRQRLKMIEDKVLDLVIIFESLYNTLAKLRKQCETHCLGAACYECNCASIIDELEEQMHEAEVNLKKADILHKRAQGTAQLLSDLLDYENAQIAQVNEKALNGLVKETKDENSKMRVLTERSTADAAAVKILTVITLIYLPVTVVANFFSSQLIRVDEGGAISVVSGSWWFAVISVPLTIITFIVWRWWVSHAIKAQERRQEESILDVDEVRSLRSKCSWASVLRSRPRRRPHDDITGA